jgi:vacuolar-type H+-ATPase subunit H
MEKELDEVKSRISDMKRILQTVAIEEAEKAKAVALEQANTLAQEKMAKVRTDAEKEAAEIVSKSKSTFQSLKERIDEKFEQAVQKVVKAVPGD